MEQSGFSPLDVERELRRIGVDLVRLKGLATSGISRTERLRGLASDRPWRYWARRVHGPPSVAARRWRPPRGPVEAPAPDVSSYRDPVIEERKAFFDELRRVVPRSTWAKGSEGFGFDPPHGLAHALAVLRALPDGAGPAAFFRALRDTPPL